MSETGEHCAPDASLVIATGCAHCQAVLVALANLVKEGAVGRLEVVNVTVRPEAARGLDIRSLPWLRLGRLEFTGLMRLEELRRWAEQADTEEGLQAYFLEQLATGQMPAVAAYVRSKPDAVVSLVRLLGDPSSEMQVRLGVDAILEELDDERVAAMAVQVLADLPLSGNARTRADACHALRLTRLPQAVAVLKECLADADGEVRETAEESLQALTEAGMPDAPGGAA